jgi:hypothetical protein
MSKDDDEEPLLGVDLIFGGPDVEQPDWRTEDADDEISDNDDPKPISPQFLMDVLGFDVDEAVEEEEDEEDEAVDDDDNDEEEDEEEQDDEEPDDEEFDEVAE